MPSVEATTAAKWWAEALRQTIVRDDGKDGERFAALARFEDLLANWIDMRLAETGRPVPLTTSDRGPQLHLGDRAREAQLNIGSMDWPRIAAMWVQPGSVYVHVGYNSLRTTLLDTAQRKAGVDAK